MSKLSRNVPCPCGSGKKYKKCCLLREEVSATQPPQVSSDIFKHIHAQMEELDNLSNSVVDLIQAGKLDEAEARCHKLLGAVS